MARRLRQSAAMLPAWLTRNDCRCCRWWAWLCVLCCPHRTDEFRKNLILTGNISGLTTEKFNAMAQSMADVSGITRGAAAEALTAMAASGTSAQTPLAADKIRAAVRKAGGPAVAEP